MKGKITELGNKLLFDNCVTKWIDKEGDFPNDYVKDGCDPQHKPKKKTVPIVIRIIWFVIVVITFAIFANVLSIPLCLFNKDTRGF